MLSADDPRFKVLALWIRHYFCDCEQVESVVQLVAQSTEAENFLCNGNTLALEVYENVKTKCNSKI